MFSVLRFSTIKNLRNVRTFASSTSNHFDIIIAGGGLVGTSLACALSKNKILSERNVLLLEGAPPFKGFECGEYGNRVSALNNNTVDFFKNIGVWEKISAARFKPVKQMQVWDASSNASITFNHDNFSENVAYIIENDLVLDSVYKELESAKNVQIKNLAKIEDVDLEGLATKSVKLKGGEEFTCDLLIGADGVNSLVRKQMKVDTYTHNYNEMGLVATLELDGNACDNSVAWQRFLPTGPVALLPLNENKSSLVWSTTPEMAKKLQSLPADEFVDELNKAFVKEYPKNEFVSNALRVLDTIMNSDSQSSRQYPPKVRSVVERSRACFPLGFMHSSSYVRSGVALVGDAAHRIHPLAGQGVNLGFGDVKCLVEVLADGVYGGATLSDKLVLLKYEKDRLVHNVPLMLGIHGIQSLYSSSFSPLVLLRSLGLQITQNAPPLKNLFMKKAMG
ncbi:COQ6 family protein [Megaselia abdita]